MQKRIAIFGSTGSIGTQALEVISQHPDLFEVEVLTALNNVDLLIEQSIRYTPNVVVIGNENHYERVKSALENHPIKVYCGADAIAQVGTFDSVDMVLTAMVGFSGLKPTIEAIRAGKSIALANKETLVVAGELIMKEAEANRVPIIPVDSEHSAIYQCLVGEGNNRIEKIILTASGGPFREWDIKDLERVSPDQALRHPNWCMGPKITIDSATLMNKGLEVIEARWLFGVGPDEIEVVVHPQSIIHSMVQFSDGSIKAQMGLPDMRLPIQYAFSYPHRFDSDFERFDFLKHSNLTFEQPDTKIFRNLALSYEALRKGGNWPCILNAANEVAVEAFLKEKIGFLQIPDVIEETLSRSTHIKAPELEDYLNSDLLARQVAQEQI
ncbi:MAG: 1-deoxy-D-xylulose-5-phosphate reductoisomerase [Bacteroidetes bacterium]|nr:MAG: 1-deoxy-D-xylulose-5-phosphate reductoisomerase [Bacteroidota bacterium]RLD72553.1 MAG: 1-deoxy-D-xylulose-5-phosphate reductoisomerase [Bacteroidota bacterium]RLD94942.1 MAG: 1-deoxy-D-xylulose-5-phosphate reductoisomerase [Bacteroidota bacterium]